MQPNNVEAQRGFKVSNIYQEILVKNYPFHETFITYL